MAERLQEVWLVRHGETEWSRSGQHTGVTDVPLTERGRKMAAALRPRLEGHEFAKVLSSPLARALDTCRLAGLGDRCETTDQLLEWNYGIYEGRKTVDIRKSVPGWTVWHDGCPEGEQAADVGRRVDQVIAQVRSINGDVIMFAHGHVLRVLSARWIELPPQGGQRLYLSTGTLGILGYEREASVIRQWNDGSHIENVD